MSKQKRYRQAKQAIFHDFAPENGSLRKGFDELLDTLPDNTTHVSITIYIGKAGTDMKADNKQAFAAGLHHLAESLQVFEPVICRGIIHIGHPKEISVSAVD